MALSAPLCSLSMDIPLLEEKKDRKKIMKIAHDLKFHISVPTNPSL